MKKLIFSLISLVLAAFTLQSYNYKYWDDLTTKEQIAFIKRPYVNKEAIAFLHGKFEIIDNDWTFHLLDTLVSARENCLPLYFYLFNKIVKLSDGALSESMGTYCYKMLKRNPTYVINFFNKERTKSSLTDSSMLKIYAFFIGDEYGFAKDGVSEFKEPYESFKRKLLSNKKISESKDLKITLDMFFKELEKAKKEQESDSGNETE